MPKYLVALGVFMASAFTALPAMAAELDATTSAAIGAGLTDAQTSVNGFISANVGTILLTVIAISLVGLAIKYVRRIIGR